MSTRAVEDTAACHEAQRYAMPLVSAPSSVPSDWQPVYSRWRHGGWYVNNVIYESGAVGCVSRNYPDRKWRIVCDKRRLEDLNEQGDFTYPSRDAAARAEYALANAE